MVECDTAAHTVGQFLSYGGALGASFEESVIGIAQYGPGDLGHLLGELGGHRFGGTAGVHEYDALPSLEDGLFDHSPQAVGLWGHFYRRAVLEVYCSVKEYTLFQYSRAPIHLDVVGV